MQNHFTGNFELSLALIFTLITFICLSGGIAITWKLELRWYNCDARHEERCCNTILRDAVVGNNTRDT